MARVTAWLAGLSFACGCLALVFGIRVGHGSGELSTHLLWAVLALGLQLFTAGIAAVHARASERELALLRGALGAGDLSAGVREREPGQPTLNVT